MSRAKAIITAEASNAEPKDVSAEVLGSVLSQLSRRNSQAEGRRESEADMSEGRRQTADDGRELGKQAAEKGGKNATVGVKRRGLQNVSNKRKTPASAYDNKTDGPDKKAKLQRTTVKLEDIEEENEGDEELKDIKHPPNVAAARAPHKAPKAGLFRIGVDNSPRYNGRILHWDEFEAKDYDWPSFKEEYSPASKRPVCLQLKDERYIFRKVDNDRMLKHWFDHERGPPRTPLAVHPMPRVISQEIIPNLLMLLNQRAWVELKETDFESLRKMDHAEDVFLKAIEDAGHAYTDALDELGFLPERCGFAAPDDDEEAAEDGDGERGDGEEAEDDDADEKTEDQDE